MDLAGRLRALIEEEFSGNVNRAAKAWGVAQPTLHRFLHNPVRNPRVESLRRIASYYDLPIERLWDGAGPRDADGPTWSVEFRAWKRLVRRLRLPETVEPTLLTLPTANLVNAHYILCDWGLMFRKGKRMSDASREKALRSRDSAGQLQLTGWTVWLRGLITAYGRNAVRTKLLSVVDRLRLGFQPFASFLFETGAITGDLERLHRPFSPQENWGPPSVVVYSKPTRPPLNAARHRQPNQRPSTDIS
jgi:hypothetical protein